MTDRIDDRLSMRRVRRSKEEARAAYDRMSAWYDLLAGSSEQPHVRAGLRELDAREGERILEIGFGTGRALVSLVRAVGRSGQVYGLDISGGMAQRTWTRLKGAGLADEAALILGDGARLPLRDESLDGIFMSFSLELFDTPRIPGVLRACRRVLAGKGRLCVVSMAKPSRASLAVWLYEWVHDKIPRYVDCRPIPVASVVERAGFEIVNVERRSMWTLPVDVVVAERRQRSPGESDVNDGF